MADRLIIQTSMTPIVELSDDDHDVTGEAILKDNSWEFGVQSSSKTYTATFSNSIHTKYGETTHNTTRGSLTNGSSTNGLGGGSILLTLAYLTNTDTANDIHIYNHTSNSYLLANYSLTVPAGETIVFNADPDTDRYWWAATSSGSAVLRYMLKV